MLGVLCGAFEEEVEGAGEEAARPECSISELVFSGIGPGLGDSFGVVSEVVVLESVSVMFSGVCLGGAGDWNYLFFE